MAVCADAQVWVRSSGMVSGAWPSVITCPVEIVPVVAPLTPGKVPK